MFVLGNHVVYNEDFSVTVTGSSSNCWTAYSFSRKTEQLGTPDEEGYRSDEGDCDQEDEPEHTYDPLVCDWVFRCNHSADAREYWSLVVAGRMSLIAKELRNVIACLEQFLREQVNPQNNSRKILTNIYICRRKKRTSVSWTSIRMFK